MGTYFFAQVGGGSVDWWPFAVLVISVSLIIFLITVLKVHAFLALILAAFAAGLLSRPGRLEGEPLKSHWLQAIELTTSEFGVTAGKIGVVIALASVIGMCLMESGAADKVVRRFLSWFGEKRAGTAIMASGYILSIPIFFDTFFMLLLPLARAMRIRTGKDYLLYVMAICCGGTVTHSLVAPHPGPLTMAEYLKIDLGLTIMVGTVFGIFPTLISWLVVKWINRRMDIPLRETAGASLADLQNVVQKRDDELPSFFASILPVILPILLISLASTLIAIQGKVFDEGDLKDPRGFALKLKQPADPLSQHIASQLSDANRAELASYNGAQPLPSKVQRALQDDINEKILRRQALYTNQWINALSLREETKRLQAKRPQAENLVRLNRMILEDTYPAELKRGGSLNAHLFTCGLFIGNRNVALLIGALLAIGVLMRQRGYTLAKIGELIGPPFETAGVIILITAAGGAFGLMLKNAGVGDTVKAVVAGKEVNLILLSWLVAAVIRVAQGSATVAMLTTASMMYPITVAAGLPFHPIYIFLAIGFGAMFLSWMNDSGFWVVGKLSGFTEKETLKTWSIVLTVNSVAGLVLTFICAKLLPFA
jgi:gluconate:H+ symporter, GntP family